MNSNKLLSQQLKNFINKMKIQELEQLLDNFKKSLKTPVEIDTQSKGYKCFETLLTFDSISAKGYGRDQTEAQENAYKIFFDNILEQKPNFTMTLKDCFRSIKQLQQINTSNISNSINLNFSQESCHPIHQGGEVEILTQKIGNLSAINDLHNYNSSVTNETQEGPQLLQEIFYNNEKNQTQTANPQKTPEDIVPDKKLQTLQVPPNPIQQKQKQYLQEKQKQRKLEKRPEHSLKENIQEPCNEKYCYHEEKYKNERKKVQHLEKRLKLIEEENIILRSLIEDKEKTQNKLVFRNKANQSICEYDQEVDLVPTNMSKDEGSQHHRASVDSMRGDSLRKKKYIEEEQKDDISPKFNLKIQQSTNASMNTLMNQIFQTDKQKTQLNKRQNINFQ